MWYYLTLAFSLVILCNSTIWMRSATYSNDPNYANVITSLGVNANNDSYLNASAETFVDLAKLMVIIELNKFKIKMTFFLQMTFTFSLPKNEQDKNYEMTLLQSTISSCKILNGTRGNFIIKMLLDDLDKFIDFKFSCPFQAQKFGMYNFLPQEKFLPAILQNRSIKFQLITKFDGKLLNAKKSVWLFSFKVLGEIRNNNNNKNLRNNF